ncbi:MAG: RDD family protein [Candidatus Hodarchaeales archaeon]|jgi:uncharacterized RDD family membrane protein YckC
MASTLKIIAGLFVLMIGFPIFIGGSAVLIITPLLQDNDGYFMTQNFNIEETGVAAIRADIPLESVYIGVQIDPGKLVTLKMEVHGETTSDKVFLGLAKKADVDTIFTSNVSYYRITDLDLSSQFDFGREWEYSISGETIENTTAWAAPQITGITWIGGTGIDGTSFTWAPKYEELTEGSLSLIMMNLDHGTSNTVDITFRIGAKIPFISAIGWILVVFGGLFTLLAVILLWSGIRTKKPRVERVRYYQGAPAQRVEPVTKPTPKFQLQCSNCGALNEPDSTFCAQCGEILLSEDRKTVEDVTREKKVEVLEPTGHRLVVADGGARFWAWLIDFVIIGMVTSSLSSLLFFSLDRWEWWSLGILGSIGPTSVIFFLYAVFMEYNYGQTLGKMALNLEVVSERSGERPTLEEIAISAVGKAFFLPVDVIIAMITRDESQIPNLEQRLTQKWAKIVVIQQEKKKEESAQFISRKV